MELGKTTTLILSISSLVTSVTGFLKEFNVYQKNKSEVKKKDSSK